jgi:hypothetical protein
MSINCLAAASEGRGSFIENITGADERTINVNQFATGAADLAVTVSYFV